MNQIITELFKQYKYEEILSIVDFNSLELDIHTYGMIAKSLFFSEYFERLVDYITYLSNHNIESYELLYYQLLAQIAICSYDDDFDIFTPLSLFKRYKLVKDKKTQDYFGCDVTKYHQLLLESCDYQRVLIIALFLDSQVQKTEKSLSIAINYYELISSLFEIGFDNQIINELTEYGHIIFKI